MINNWVGLLLFVLGILAGAILIALLPGMPWSSTQQVLDLPLPTDQHDLAAQRSMASVAWYMFGATALTAVTSIIALILLQKNLEAAREVNKLAERSTKAAEDAAREAQLTTTQARDLGTKQLRAYVSVENVRYALHGTGAFQLSFDVKNSGATPALHMVAEIFFEQLLSAEPGNAPVRISHPSHLVRPDLAAGDLQHIEIGGEGPLYITPPFNALDLPRGSLAKLTIKIRYDDIVLGGDQVATFYFESERTMMPGHLHELFRSPRTLEPHQLLPLDPRIPQNHPWPVAPNQPAPAN